MNRFIGMLLLIVVAASNLCCAEVFQHGDRLYIDENEFSYGEIGSEFYIHIGNNVWLITNIIHKDDSGVFALENEIIKSTFPEYNMEYERKWKCPYCYNYWPIGKPCGNSDCPSKYK